jgi:putative transposase
LTYDPERHHRRSIRLKGYDYHQAGAHLVTIVTHDRALLFGEVVDGRMQLNDAGRMVRTVWDEILLFYPGVDIDAFVAMPNRIHGIIVLPGDVSDVGAGPRARSLVATVTIPEGQPQGVAPTDTPDDATIVGAGPRARPLVADRLSLAEIVGRFKSLTTRRYTDGVIQSRWPPYGGRLWQRNYHEHIIRDTVSLQRIRAYITANPSGWASDDENPEFGYCGKRL